MKGRGLAGCAFLLLAFAGDPAGTAAAEMLRIPASEFRPLYGDAQAPPTQVPAFFLDRTPVTNAEFLNFLRAVPAWRRSQVSRLFAAPNYLAHWAGDLELGPQAPPDSPVTQVSWFAARAYAEWRGARLPSLAEWETAAGAGFADAEAQRRLLDWYGRPLQLPLPAVGTTAPNAWGVRDLHGLIWEWVEDFNSSLVTGESRADGDLDRGLFCAGGAASAAQVADYAAFMRYAFRSSLAGRDCVGSLGFRCARDVAPAEAPTRRER